MLLGFQSSVHLELSWTDIELLKKLLLKIYIYKEREKESRFKPLVRSYTKTFIPINGLREEIESKRDGRGMHIHFPRLHLDISLPR